MNLYEVKKETLSQTKKTVVIKADSRIEAIQKARDLSDDLFDETQTLEQNFYSASGFWSWLDFFFRKKR